MPGATPHLLLIEVRPQHRDEGTLLSRVARSVWRAMLGVPTSANMGRTTSASRAAAVSARMLLMYERNAVDEYGLPLGILGAHPNEFYGAIGRVVCLCAVLEDKVATLRHTLERADQGIFTRQPVSKQITRARDLSRGLPEPGPEKIGAFCDNARAAFARTMNLCTVRSRPSRMGRSGDTAR